MDDNTIQDIIPPKKSIRDVPLPTRRQPSNISSNNASIESIDSSVIPVRTVSTSSAVSTNLPEKNVNQVEEETVFSNYSEINYRSGFRKTPWLIGGAILFGALLSFIFLYAKADVLIMIKNDVVDATLSATSTRDGANATIPYSIITLTKEESIEVPAGTTLKNTTAPKPVVQTTTTTSGSQNIISGKKAFGTITISNNTESSQTLVATTRFQTKDGLVYRIDKDITVPARKGGLDHQQCLVQLMQLFMLTRLDLNII